MQGKVIGFLKLSDNSITGIHDSNPLLNTLTYGVEFSGSTVHNMVLTTLLRISIFTLISMDIFIIFGN